MAHGGAHGEIEGAVQADRERTAEIESDLPSAGSSLTTSLSTYSIAVGITVGSFGADGLLMTGATPRFLYRSLSDTAPDDSSYADYIPSTGMGIYSQVLDFDYDGFLSEIPPQVLYNSVQNFDRNSPETFTPSGTGYGAGIDYNDNEQQGLENQYGSIPDGLSVSSYLDSTFDLLGKEVLQTFYARTLTVQKIQAPTIRRSNITGFRTSEAAQGVSVGFSTSTTTGY